MGSGVTYSLETNRSGDGVYDGVCMGKVREVAGLDALEVHGLKRYIECSVNHELDSTDKLQINRHK